MSPELSAVIAKVKSASLPAFDGIDLTDVNAKGHEPFQETMLHVVSTWGDTESAKVLIAEGAEIDPTGEHRFTPLHEATNQGHKEMIELLVSYGASTRKKSNLGDFFDLAELSNDPKIRTLAKEIKQGEQGSPHKSGQSFRD